MLPRAVLLLAQREKLYAALEAAKLGAGGPVVVVETKRYQRGRIIECWAAFRDGKAVQWYRAEPRMNPVAPPAVEAP